MGEGGMSSGDERGRIDAMANLFSFFPLSNPESRRIAGRGEVHLARTIKGCSEPPCNTKKKIQKENKWRRGGTMQRLASLVFPPSVLLV